MTRNAESCPSTPPIPTLLIPPPSPRILQIRVHIFQRCVQIFQKLGTLSLTSGSAPAARSFSTAAWCPPFAACCSAVLPTCACICFMLHVVINALLVTTRKCKVCSVPCRPIKRSRRFLNCPTLQGPRKTQSGPFAACCSSVLPTCGLGFRM